MMSFFAEIKRRKVYRVAVAYAVVAWALVQIVGEIKEPLGLPLWIDTFVIVLLAIGFPLALILSWLFDWSPQGFVRDKGGDNTAEGRAPETDARAPTMRLQPGGQTLRELVAAGPLPPSRLLRLAVRISSELAKIHSAEHINGALTPDRIAVSADDRVEISGLTKADGALASAALEASSYTAPECARGRESDDRSDQFSLGAIFYEMATGRRAFVGADKEETLAAVVNTDPEPIGRFNPETPMPLQWAIERCLAKRPEERFASVHDLHADLAAIAESIAVVTSSRLAPKHNLPAQRTEFIGREKDLEDLEKLVTNEATRLVTLTGAGGIGKTRMLIELGRELLEAFKGGVFFVPLDTVQDAELVVSEIVKSLSVRQQSDRGTEDVLRSYLRQYCVAPALLLIDNFEHVLDAAPKLSEILGASDQIKIVVTSRAALRLYGEHEFRVAPLVLASADASAEEIAEFPAVRLFLDRAVSLSGNLDEQELRIVAEICARLDGLPLAIELAAARTKVLTLADLLERIRHPLQLLSGGPRDRPARQQTLRATLEWSYELLNEDQKRLFRRIGVFVGGATLEAIEAVCNVDEDIEMDIVEGVESLVDNSLLRQMESAGPEARFTMLETMREYALLRLGEAREEARTRRAHAAYCMVLAEESTYAKASPHWRALYDRYDRESGNLRVALDWLVDSRNAEWGLKLVQWLGHYWVQRGQVAEGYERLRKLLPFVKEDSSQLALALSWAGDLSGNIGRTGEAELYYRDSLALAKERHDVTSILRSLNGLAVNRQQSGLLEDAKTYHEEAVDIARKEGAPPAVLGGMLSNSADNAMARGDLDLAEQLHAETAQLFAGVGDEAALAWALNRLGDVARRRRDVETARSSYEQALGKFRALGDKAGMAGCLYDLAALDADAGNFAAAGKLNRESLSLYRELGQITVYPRVLEAMSRCMLESGEPGRALTLAGGAAAMRQSLSLKRLEAASRSVEACVHSARQTFSDSEATSHWMAGWSMQPDQLAAFALLSEGATSAQEL